MPSRFFPAVLLTSAIVLTGLAVPASAAPGAGGARSYDDPRYAGSTTVEVEGTLVRAEVDQFGDEPSSDAAYAVRTTEDVVVPVTLTKDLPANGTFSGRLVVRGQLAKALDREGLLPAPGRTIDGDSAAGQSAVATAEEQGAPVPVAEATVVPEPEPETAATVTPAAHRAYVVKMVDQGSVDGDNASIGAAVDSMLSYWTTESDGGISSFSRVGSILDYDSASDPPTTASCGMQSPFPIWDDAKKLFPGINIYDPGNHLIVLVGEECGGTGPVGVATVGSSIASGGPSMLTYNSEIFGSTGAHELGHNFGLQHANLDTCCEYFDLYSPMALSISGATFAPPALGSLYRTELGLPAGGEVTSVALGSGQTTLTQSYDLAPRSSSAGQRGLLVTDPSSNTTYSVDWRTHTGRDANTFYGAGYGLGGSYPTYNAGVVIERQAAGLGATYLLTHVNSQGVEVGAYGAGETFTPSPRLSIVAGASGAVTVTIAPDPTFDSATPTISGTVAVDHTVTAVPGAWTSGTSFAYDWRLDGASTGQTGVTYAVPASADGKTLTVRVTGSKSGFTSVTKDSAGSAVAKGTLDSPTPTISGTVAVDQTVTATPGAWTSGTSFAYDWRLDGASTGQTSATFAIPASAEGKALNLRITGSKTGYTSLTKESLSKTIAAAALDSSTPTISGTVAVDQTVTAVPGAWTSGASFTYDWRLDGTSTGQTGSTYEVPASADGKTLTVRVTGSKTGYGSVTKDSTGATVAPSALISATPTITGTKAVGETVTAEAGTWSIGAQLGYEWFLDGATTGQFGATYLVPDSADGRSLTVKVTGTRPGYTTVTKESAAASIAKGTLTSATPTISGTVAVDQTVTATPGTWTPGTTFAYDWWLDGTSTGQTRSTYEVPAAADGRALTVKVTGTRPGYTTVTKESAAASIAKGTLASATPTVAGTKSVGQTVTVLPGSWATGTDFTYDWQLDGASTGQTGATYLIPATASGKNLSVRVAGSKTGFTTVTSTSAASTVAKGTLKTATPKISGTAKVGRSLTASATGWTAATRFTYRWYSGTKAITSSSTSRTYKIAKAYRGKKLTVKVTGTKTGYTTVVKTSAATKAVAR